MLWLAALVIVWAGWGAGYLFWSPPGSHHETYFSLADTRDALVVGVPTSLTGALLLTRPPRRVRVLGRVVVLGGACAAAYVLSFAFFGICIDPGEACAPSWPSRLLALAAGTLSVLVGYAVFRLRGGATTDVG